MTKIFHFLTGCKLYLLFFLFSENNFLDSPTLLNSEFFQLLKIYLQCLNNKTSPEKTSSFIRFTKEKNKIFKTNFESSPTNT